MSQTYTNILATDLISDSRTVITDRDDASATWFLGAAEPASMAAGRPWIDTTLTLIKVRNATNTGWITIGTYVTGMGHLPLSGGTMTADLDLGGNKLVNLPTPATDGEATNKDYTTNNLVLNKGKAWISHGDNVITFTTAHSNASYKFIATLVKSAMGGVTTRCNPHTRPLALLHQNESTTRVIVRINGGHAFSSCGYIAAVTGTTQRYDDIANTHTARTAATARDRLAGYSLNGLGFTSGGFIAADSGITERFDDVINAHVARTVVTARESVVGYSLNGYGFTSCGNIAGVVTGTTERLDDAANTQTARLAATARRAPAGYGLNNYGFTSCGYIAATTGLTERFDDDANTHTARLAATARYYLTGYSLNGFGFTTCGDTGAPAIVGTTQRFDDEANTHTARLAATIRKSLGGCSLNGFGFTIAGENPAGTNVTTVQRFDDVANTHTARAAATARRNLTGYATNEYFINYVTFNE